MTDRPDAAGAGATRADGGIAARAVRRAPVARRALDAGWEIARDPAGPWRAIGAPTTVAAALDAAGEWSIDDPPRRFDAETWWFRVRIVAPVPPRRIVFDGLATGCEVLLDGRVVLSARNMFRRHVVEVDPADWRAGGVEMVLRFGALDEMLAPRRPRPRWRAPMVAHQQLRWVRTTLLGRTPGWSPAAAPVGPWRDVWLEDGEPAFEVVERRVALEGDAGVVDLALRLPASSAATPVRAVLSAPDGRRVEWALERDADGLHRGRGRLADAPRWWPHTHGTPQRCTLAVAIDGTLHRLAHAGFRTIEIDRGADGEGFGLVVNGVPVFARGACWVPLDPLRLRGTPAQHVAALAQLREAGANMVRVGGTMVYEDETFLEACDAAGVMVWHEFMFANLDYPADDPAFAAEVVAEAAEQLALWRDHPCVAVVCGNSEVAQQAAMWGAPRALWTPPLFHATLAAAVAAVLPDTPWWPSSASGGAFPFQPNAGTTSYYGVGAYLRPLQDARTSGVRFASEALAFAQVPDDLVLARMASLQDGLAVRPHQPLWKERVPRDLGAGWDFDDVRDHYLEARFGRPAAEARRDDLARYWADSRAATAETMAAAYAQWRDPAGACRGALVWFLRDLRAGAGWGVLDDGGHPKAAFHALRRAWRPLQAGLVDEGQNGIVAWVVNEPATPFEGSLVLSFHQRGEVAVGRVERPLALPPHGAWRENVLAHAEGFIDLAGHYRFGPAAADVVVATLRDAAGTALQETVLFLDRLGAPAPLERRDLGLVATAQRARDGHVQVTLFTRAAARGVHVEAPGWRASDDAFDLPPLGRRTLDFAPVAGATRTPPVPLVWYARVTAVNGLDAAPVPLAEATA